MRWPDDLLEQVDEARGGRSRTSFVLDAVRAYLSDEEPKPEARMKPATPGTSPPLTRESGGYRCRRCGGPGRVDRGKVVCVMRCDR